MRNLALSNFNQIFYLSTGFCTVEYRNGLIKTNCFSLCNDIYNTNFFDEKFVDFYFYFEENYFTLKKRLKHFSLFSICLHFLRCVRCCDKKSNYCRVCSSLGGGYIYDCNFFFIFASW